MVHGSPGVSASLRRCTRLRASRPRKLASSPRSWKSVGPGVLRGERLQIGQQGLHASGSPRGGRRPWRSRPARPSLCRGRPGARAPRRCGAPAPSRRCGRSGPGRRSTPPPTITKYCGTALAVELAHAALEAEAGDVVLAAAVRAAADLDVEVRGASTRPGRARRCSWIRRAEPARLRDREAAGLGPGAARDVGDRAGAAAARGRPRRAGGAGPAAPPRAPSGSSRFWSCVMRSVPSPKDDGQVRRARAAARP